MNPNSSTYRLFSLLLVVLVFTSASIPAGLHQHDHDSKECSNPAHQHETMSHGDAEEDCDEHQTDNHKSDNADHENACDLGIACACSIEEAPVKPEAVPGFASAKVVLTKTGQDLLQPFKQFQHFLEAPEPNLNSYPPPIFLLVSTFLN